MLVSGPTSEADTRIYRVNGIDMRVHVAGEGPDVLLVHGFPDTHLVWRQQIATLVASGHRVIAPDTRGAGGSDASAAVADYRLPNLVADLVGLLDVLGIAKVRLVAHDWGAVIGWQLAAEHPERVDRYVALSVGHPSAYASDPVQWLRAYYVFVVQLPRLPERLLSAGDWRGLALFAGWDGELAAWRASLARPGRLTAALNYYRANLGLLWRHDVPPVHVPVFGVWSSGDRFLTERQMRASERFVAGPWRYACIAGANHWLQVTAPEQLNGLLLDYLRPKEVR